MKNAILLCALFLGASLYAQERPSDQVRLDRPDGHGPISIMNDHTHERGELMFSYRFGLMDMKGLIQNTQAYSDEDVFTHYKASPQDMEMNRHRVGAMYGVTDQLTLMAMAHYSRRSMDMKTKADKAFSNQAEGFGDSYLGIIYKFFDAHHASLSAYAGVNAPTGKAAKYGKNAAGEKMKLAYSMALGSGTWDARLGATYKQQWDLFSLGIQPGLLLRTGQNEKGYRLGNLYRLDLWGSVVPSKWISFSLHGQARFEDGIHGKDADLMAMMAPTANAANSGFKQLNGGIGANLYVPRGLFKDLRISAEFMHNLYENAHGIQMKPTNTLVVGLQYTLDTRS